MKYIFLLIFISLSVNADINKGEAYADCAGFFTFTKLLYERNNDIPNVEKKFLTSEQKQKYGFFLFGGNLEYIAFGVKDIPQDKRVKVAEERFQERMYKKVNQLMDQAESDMNTFNYSVDTLKTMCDALYR
jgi:hypothetical protein